MSARTPPSGCLRVASLSVATVAGVTVVALLWQVRDLLGGSSRNIRPTADWFLGYIVIGSCVALPACMMLGLPLWHLAARSGRQQRHDAVRFGLIVGATIGTVMAVFGVVADTWYAELLDFLGYCLAGMCGGSIAHRVAYRPERRRSDSPYGIAPDGNPPMLAEPDRP